MTLDEFDASCKDLPATTHVIQWGNSSVWKVGGKIFALCSPNPPYKISFKCSDLSYEILREQPGLIPAPYLARAKWVQIVEPDAMTDTDIRSYLAESHQIISRKLTRAVQRELGLAVK